MCIYKFETNYLYIIQLNISFNMCGSSLINNFSLLKLHSLLIVPISNHFICFFLISFFYCVFFVIGYLP